MRRRRLSIVIWAAAQGIASAAASPESPAAASRRIEGAPLHLYILAGQSNMAGVGGYARPRHVAPEPRAWVLGRPMLLSGPEKKPRSMPDPLWVQMGTQWKLGGRGVGPDWGFAKALLEQDPTARIGIIQIAASGSNIERWIDDPSLERGGGDYYSNVVVTVRRAMQDGVLKGFLWHQGESNTGSADYDRLFERMVIGYRQAFGTPDLPVIAGTIGADGSQGGRVNDGLARAAERMKNVRIVSSIRTRSDHVHYDADSQDEMGRRFANALLAMTGKPQALRITTRALPPGTAGTWYCQPIEAGGGDGTVRAWTCQGLPAGMTMSRDTIEGRLPDEACELTVTVSVEDGGGDDRRKLTLAVQPAAGDRIELIPSANFSMSRTFLMQGNRVLYVSPDAPHSGADRAYLRFDVPSTFRHAKRAALRLPVQSTGSRAPVRMQVRVVQNPRWDTDAIDPKDPATHPKTAPASRPFEVTGQDGDVVIDLGEAWPESLEADGAVGFEIASAERDGLAPVIFDSNRGDRKPTLILEE